MQTFFRMLLIGLLASISASAQGALAVAVTSVNNKSVFEFSAPFTPTLRASTGTFPELFTPTGIVYRGNDLVVSDTLKLNGRLLQITPSNTVSVLESFPDIITPVGLTVDNSGNVYAANYIVPKITRTTPFGSTTIFADALDGLNGPIGADFDAFGNLYVADVNNARIIKFDPLGVPTIFADASDGLFTPVDVAIDAAGNVFVADTLLGGGRVWKFNSLGVGSIFADTTDGIVSPTGIDIDDTNGDLYVANFLVDTIVKLDSLGSGTLFASGPTIDGPWGIAVRNAVIPEPGSIVVWSFLGLCVGLGWYRRRRQA